MKRVRLGGQYTYRTNFADRFLGGGDSFDDGEQVIICRPPGMQYLPPRQTGGHVWIRSLDNKRGRMCYASVLESPVKHYQGEPG